MIYLECDNGYLSVLSYVRRLFRNNFNIFMRRSIVKRFCLRMYTFPTKEGLNMSFFLSYTLFIIPLCLDLFTDTQITTPGGLF